MVPSFVLSPFQILLNNLSDELHERNLHSLIHVCGDIIPGAQRERITTGWDVFSILQQRNIIGSEPEKMANLLAINKELRPKRKDLVVKIKRHIKENYEEPDWLLKDLDSSSDNTLPFCDRVISRPPTSMPQEDCCRIYCPGFAFSCNPCCDTCCCSCCSLILAMLFSLLALLTWSLGKKHFDSEKTHGAVVCVVSVSVFLAVCSVISVICIRYCRPRDNLNYTLPPASHEIRSNLASYATLNYSRISYNSMGQRTESPRYQCSCHSAQNTASSSLTRASSVLSYPALLPDDIVPDGFPREDYPAFFAQNVEDDLIEV